MAHPSFPSTWSSSPRFSFLKFRLLALCCWLSFGAARRNITIDEDSSLITYFPASSWSKVTGDLDAGGGHMLTDDPNAYATLTYTYVSLWVMSTKWPYEVTTEYVLDGTKRTIIDLQDHNSPNLGTGGGTVASSIVASFIGSSSQTHEIGVFVAPGAKYAVLDRLIFEVEDDPTSTQTPKTATQTVVIQTTPGKSSASGSQSSAASASISHSTRNLSIALGIVGPLLALLVLFLIWWLLSRRRRSRSRTPPPISSPYEPEKSMYSGGGGSVYGAGGPAPGLHHVASYDTAAAMAGYGVPSGPYVPYVPSPSSTPGIAGVGAASYPQIQRPPYPEISDVPEGYNPYTTAGYSSAPSGNMPPQTMDGSDIRSSWVPSNSVYSTDSRGHMR
ncbi:hypothetical protein CPB83DRAFT_905679 [Crepidotus variabilis]|uniref:receptor protein-tyrosine kinase n=1 Tax=Crepidotus variabilis TaxID=179855 RepID=A0A9P6EJ73_9AGAR|nr:hypothetical protein CPB83DRAFT_905679 [Crepidotus variabilis]